MVAAATFQQPRSPSQHTNRISAAEFRKAGQRLGAAVAAAFNDESAAAAASSSGQQAGGDPALELLNSLDLTLRERRPDLLPILQKLHRELAAMPNSVPAGQSWPGDLSSPGQQQLAAEGILRKDGATNRWVIEKLDVLLLRNTLEEAAVAGRRRLGGGVAAAPETHPLQPPPEPATQPLDAAAAHPHPLSPAQEFAQALQKLVTETPGSGAEAALQRNYWTGILARNGKRKTPAVLHKIGGDLPSGVKALDGTLSISHRSTVADMSRRRPVFVGIMQPASSHQNDAFSEYVTYFRTKDRAGVVGFESVQGGPLLYMTPLEVLPEGARDSLPEWLRNSSGSVPTPFLLVVIGEVVVVSMRPNYQAAEENDGDYAAGAAQGGSGAHTESKLSGGVGGYPPPTSSTVATVPIVDDYTVPRGSMIQYGD